MAIKVTNAEVWEAWPALQRLLELSGTESERWSAQLSYRFAKLGRRLREEYVLIKQGQDRLIRIHGEKQPNDQFAIGPTMEGWTEYVARFNEILSDEAEIESRVIPLPNQEALPEEKRLHIPPILLLALLPFVEAPDEWLDDADERGCGEGAEVAPGAPHLVAVH